MCCRLPWNARFAAGELLSGMARLSHTRRRREGALDIAAGMTVEDRTDQIGDRDALVHVLAALAPKQRAVLVMRYWVDLSDGEIAATLNCSTATVRSQASRGLARLRELTATPADGAGQSRRVEHNERS